MIIEDYCSYETAMLLKEKGFNAEVKMYWSKSYKNEPILNCCPCPFDEDESEGILEIEIDNSGKSCDSNHWWHPQEFNCVAPTLQMAMKWLREVHKISIEITSTGYLIDNDVEWECDIKAGHRLYFRHITNEKSFESCAELAIKYCLENLI